MASWDVIYQHPVGRKNHLGTIEASTKRQALRIALARVRAVKPDVDPGDVWVEEPRKPN